MSLDHPELEETLRRLRRRQDSQTTALRKKSCSILSRHVISVLMTLKEKGGSVLVIGDVKMLPRNVQDLLKGMDVRVAHDEKDAEVFVEECHPAMVLCAFESADHLVPFENAGKEAIARYSRVKDRANGAEFIVARS